MGLGATVLALGSMLGSASVANAATFHYSFSNLDGDITGTVEGEIELPNAALTTDGTYTASQISITSAPVALGYTTPVNVLANALQVGINTFEVIGGVIQEATSQFAATFDVGAGVSSLSLNDVDAFASGTQLTVNGDGTQNVGDSDSITLDYSAGVSTPEPTSIITLIGVGVLGVASKKLKKKKSLVSE